MAKIRVVYTTEHTQEIDWPDDELDNLNHDNLVCRLDPDEPLESFVSDHNHELKHVFVNDKSHEF